jgi:16S rRNA (cytidine1402-2'-O)-methyltransferase
MTENYGKLFICSTPIGNLGDASFRLVETLKNSDLIIAEDTRTTLKLLARYDIRKQELQSYHDNSALQKTESIIEKIKNGKNVAIVSESGTPLISDPGYKIIKRCIDEQITVTVIPGPSAAVSALVASGLPVDRFVFIGFLPRQNQKIKKELEKLKNLPFTLIFYESPNRLQKLLEIILEIFGNRKACIAREMTKIHEEYLRGCIVWLLDEIGRKENTGQTLKGEIVLVIEGNTEQRSRNYKPDDIRTLLCGLLKKGLDRKEVFREIMAEYDIDKKTLYNIYINIK